MGGILLIKIRKVLILGLLITISLIGVIGYIILGNDFSLEEFENKIKEKGYEYKMEYTEWGVLDSQGNYEMRLDDNIIVNGTQFIFYDTLIVIYSYENNGEMEKIASTINKDAGEIIFGGLPLQPQWHRTPHFYKKGRIIVQYVGEDEKIISDLKEIMGEQFAGRE